MRTGLRGRAIVMRLTDEQLAIVITWAKRTPEVLAGDTQVQSRTRDLSVTLHCNVHL